MRIYDAESALHALAFDIKTMTEHHAEPKVIIKMIEKKLSYLKSDSYYHHVRWWTEKKKPFAKLDNPKCWWNHLDNLEEELLNQ